MSYCLFSELYEILILPPCDEKFRRMDILFDDFKSGTAKLNHDTEIHPIETPSYLGICKVVAGAKVPKRRNLGTDEGRKILLHAVAHIEYSAIDLALDHAYRFRNLPVEYYHDWLLTAIEEKKHFLMLQNLLHDLGSYYGEYSVHDGLFLAGARSAHDLAMRMAAVPRYMEANGLDAHPQIRQKLSGFNDDFARKILNTLQTIEEEEVAHVARGNRWFEFACAQQGYSQSDFIDLVAQAVPGAKFERKTMNLQARLKAGFSQEELDRVFLSNNA